ncbi:MAG: alpha/beta fold hydrolase, partial [Deltaproteobacteria bacterium]
MYEERLDEEAIEIASAAGPIEGRLRRARQGSSGLAVVAPPHPLYGGTMSNPVVVAVVRALARQGVRTLRFNWRGTGRSAGRASGSLEDAAADYGAALDALLAAGPQPLGGEPTGCVVAAGYSFGSVAAALVARERNEIGAVVLVAPPVGMLGEEPFTALEVPVAVVAGDTDEFAPASELRRVFGARDATCLHVVEGADHFFS